MKNWRLNFTKKLNYFPLLATDKNAIKFFVQAVKQWASQLRRTLVPHIIGNL